MPRRASRYFREVRTSALILVAHVSVSRSNGDGLTDLWVHIDTEGLQLTVGPTSATLEGFTFSGQLIKGSDVVTVVP